LIDDIRLIIGVIPGGIPVVVEITAWIPPGVIVGGVGIIP
jgi:hypothetical protein